MARAVAFVAAAAIVVFCVVQDRITADGVYRYVTAQRAAMAGERPPTTIDAVMRPAVRRSVEQGALWAGATAVGGLAVVVIVRRYV